MSVDHKLMIDANKTDLLDVLRVGELLLTELCGEDVLDQRTKQEILAGGIQYEINGRFLDWLKQSQPSTFTVCLEKLRGDQQNHIANLLDGTPGERPLTRETRQQIQKNIRHLSEVIDVDSGLLVLLCSKRALSRREHQEVNSEKVTEDKAMKLLQIILQKSDRTLNCFVDALRETNQAHVISALEKGNIIALHAEFRSASDLLDQFEDDLINILEPLAQQVSYLGNEEHLGEDVQPIIHELQEICQKRIKILSLKKGKSITIYLWCEGIEAMAELFSMFETRHLEHILDKIFNLVKTSVKIPNALIRVTLAAKDLQILKEAVQLNELAQNKPELAEKDSFSESREGEELQLLSCQIKTEAKAVSDMSKVELQMKKQVRGPEETEKEINRPELQLNVEMVASKIIRLKEKLEAIEQEKSQLKQRLQRTQNEITIIRKQLQNVKAERDQIQDRYDEVLQEKIGQIDKRNPDHREEFPVRIPINLLLAVQLRASLWHSVDPYSPGRQMYKPSNAMKESEIFRSYISNLIKCLTIQRRLRLAKNVEDKLNGLQEIEECFKTANQKQVDGCTHIFISPMDNFHNVMTKLLRKNIDSCDSTVSPKSNPQQVESKRRELCYNRTASVQQRYVAHILEMVFNIMNQNILRPSCFHTAAYEANFYWTIFGEERNANAVESYKKAIDICNKWILHASAIQNSISFIVFFGVQELPIIISNRWSVIFDKYIQIVLGFLSLEKAITNRRFNSNAINDLDVVVQVYPIDLLGYIRYQCQYNLKNYYLLDDFFTHEIQNDISRVFLYAAARIATAKPLV